MKKIATIISIVIILLIIAAAGATIVYSNSDDYTGESFPENTNINGVDCSGLTYEQAAEKLTDEWNKKSIVITGKLNDQMATFTNFGCTYDIAKSLSEAKNDYKLSAMANHYIHTPLIIQIPMIVDKYSDEFKEQVTNAPFLHGEGATVTRDAYVDISKEGFPIVPEVYGTKPDADKFFGNLIQHIQTGEIKFMFDEKDYYVLPEVKSDDSSLKDYREYCLKNLSQKITYKLGDETYTIDTETLNGLLMDDMSGNPDETAVKKYVASMAKKYNNVGVERNFVSLTGKSVYVPGGTYGWEIDEKEEARQLMADIMTHKDVTREPVFSSKGYGEYSKEVGDTYIDADLSNQVVRLYKNGVLQFSSATVTGCRATGHTTPAGAFYILNKARNVVLKGDNGDGTRYASPVSYWLGVTWSGVGFHDANWRSSFGGSIWINNGSHGCLNMPPSLMPSLYNIAEVGMPVIIHY